MTSRKATTPMMEQYLGVKAQYPDTLLLYRMGDFYETFYDDAVLLSKELGIALTSRNPSDAEPIPLAGIPWHSAEPQIAKLLRAGHRVAICEQVDAAAPGRKGLMERRVVEVLSPGTAVTDPLLDRSRFNYLASLCGAGERLGIAAADISTGRFLAGDLTWEEMEEELAILAPAEILLPQDWQHAAIERFLADHLPGAVITRCDAWKFASARGDGLLREHFRVASLEGFGFKEPTSGIGAAAALLEYAREQKQAPLVHLRDLERVHPSSCLVLDDASLRGLEVLESLGGGAFGGATLVSVLDRTRTAAGGRRLRETLARPFRDPEPAQARLDRVESLILDPTLRETAQRRLAEVSDIERILGRLHCQRATPRDLGGLRRSLEAAPVILGALEGLDAWSGMTFPGPLRDVADELARALVDTPALTVKDGEVFRQGYDPELDRIRDAAHGGKRWMAALEAEEREKTGIPNLKVGYNRVFGYYIEVTRSQLSRVPDRFTRKQTLSTGERYVTPELKEQEERILGAEEAHARRQEDLLRSLVDRVGAATPDLQTLARHLAEIDLCGSFAEVSSGTGYTRPVLDRSTLLILEDARHPVVERTVGVGSFVPNDIDLDGEERQIVLLTGPNMAGKSTYLRQTGLIVLMAQAGCFVPAKRAVIGVADRIFTRVGAHDVLSRGQSTFLVEMIETSNILRNATSESIVLMDEVGRGTSTYDGVSIAWAVAEALGARPGSRPRTIFATHYHELTALGDRPGYQNLNVLVREWGDEVVFLRRVAPGAADRSYGIEVARLAGVPEDVVRRAREVLGLLERRGAQEADARRAAPPREEQLPLFGSRYDWLVDDLRSIDPHRLTPMEALERIDRWRRRIDESP